MKLAPGAPPIAVAVKPVGYAVVAGTVRVTADCVATVAFTVAGVEGALSLKVASPRRVAVTLHVPVLDVMVTTPLVNPTLHAPEALKLYAPVPLPPLAPTVKLAPNGCGDAGMLITLTAAWFCFALTTSVTPAVGSDPPLWQFDPAARVARTVSA